MNAPDSSMLPADLSIHKAGSAQFDFGATADERALRLELERRLTDIQDALFQATAEMQRRLAEAERHVGDLDRARAVLLAERYYRLYSHPVLGRPLRLLRRMVRWAARFARRESGFGRRYRG